MLTTTRPMPAEITAPETLQAAWERIKAKGARGGLDDVSLEEFARDFEARLDDWEPGSDFSTDTWKYPAKDRLAEALCEGCWN